MSLQHATTETANNIFHVLGFLAAICSLFAVLTYIIFPPLRRLRYIELLFYISVSGCIAALALSIGRQKDGSNLCNVQGVVANIFLLSMVLWTTVVSYQLYLVIFYKQVIRDLSIFHVLCWGVPVCVSCLVYRWDSDDRVASYWN